MLRTDLSDEVIISRIKEFLEQHPEGYDEDTKEFIERCALWGRNTSTTVSELDQIYNYLELDQEDNNIYRVFADLVESKFDINRPIYEIGGGNIPTVGKILALRQQKGTVTIYDPRLIFTKTDIPNLRLVKKPFTGEEIVESNALMIRYKPCDVTIPLMNYVADNNLDFMVALCDCAHNFPEILDNDGLNLWYQACEWPIYRKFYTEDGRTKKKRERVRRVKRLSMEEYDNPSPIIYNILDVKE